MEKKIEKITEDIHTEDKAKMYVKFNKDGTYGFYHVEEHGKEITKDKSYIPITDEGYQTLMDNQGDLVIGDLPKGVTEISVEHFVEAPIPPEPVESINRRTLSETLLTYQEEMRAFNAMSNPDITDAQMKRAVKRLNRASIKLIRIVLNKLEALD